MVHSLSLLFSNDIKLTACFSLYIKVFKDFLLSKAVFSTAATRLYWVGTFIECIFSVDILVCFFRARDNRRN